jgi:acetylglutamate kinase
VRRDDAALLEEINTLLSEPAMSSLLVSIASPLNLLKELFTVKGAGTLVKAGAAIDRLDSYAAVDVERIRGLLESSFGKRLDAAFFERPPLDVYVESSYRGVAILHPCGIAPFLSKFAVEPVAQGEGIGQDLWHALLRDHPAVFWRARPDNPIVGWYISLSDGMQRTPRWLVFWRGIDPPRIADVIAEAIARPADFDANGG